MKGTEKQIAWATDILKEKNEQVKTRREKVAKDISEFEKRGLMRPGHKDKMQEIVSLADEWLGLDWSDVDASWVIECVRVARLTM